MGAIRDFLLGPEREIAKRDTSVVPIEGTDMSLWWSQIPTFWQQTYGSPWYGTPDLAERVWVANRCIQLNAQQIGSMPVRFHGPPSVTSEPAWVAAPDPNWYPNGISDAVFAITRLLYAYGFACLYVTEFYADGFPSHWTVLDSSRITIEEEGGRRRYRFGETEIDASRVVQIDRNPGPALHGTPALRAFAPIAYASMAATNQTLGVTTGGYPTVYLQTKQNIDGDQAVAVQTRWAERTSERGGLPPVIGPDLSVNELSFNPADLALLDTQEFTARVIAAAFGVPAILLNIPMTGGLNYQNPALLGEQWWRFELRPTAKRIADALSAQLLPRGQFVTFEAEDTFAPIDPTEVATEEDDPQLSNVVAATPTQQPGPLVAVSGGGG